MKKKVFLALLVLMVGTLPVTATWYVWQNPAGGAWDDSANWNPATGYPNSAGDVAVFTNLYLTSNQVLQVTLPANAVTVGMVRVIGASNMYELIGGRLVLTNAASANATIYTATAFSLNRPAYLSVLSEVEFLQDTLIALSHYNLNDGLYLQGRLYGNGTITRGVSTSTGGACTITNPANEFTGLVRAHSGYQTYVYNNALSNCAGVKVSYNGSFGCYGYDTIRTITFNTIGQLTFPGGSGGNSYGDWILNSTNVTFTIYSGRTLYGSLSGTGDVTIAGNTYLNLYGAVKPGGDTVGSLSLIKTGGNLQIGIAASRAQLHIDVAGSGGVPGVDHDYLLVRDTVAALNLSNIVLHAHGTGWQETNWFLEVLGTNGLGYIGTFFDVTNDTGKVSEVIYDTANRRVGLLVIPEPALLSGLALAMALGHRRRQ